MAPRPLIKNVVVTKRFFKDFGDTDGAKAYVSQILACSNVDFHEMHKYELNVDGNLIFRAKKERVHMVYAVDNNLRLVFMRAFRNYSEYGKFLEDRREIKRALSRA